MLTPEELRKIVLRVTDACRERQCKIRPRNCPNCGASGDDDQPKQDAVAMLDLLRTIVADNKWIYVGGRKYCRFCFGADACEPDCPAPLLAGLR